jgi:hypothetical protein
MKSNHAEGEKPRRIRILKLLDKLRNTRIPGNDTPVFMRRNPAIEPRKLRQRKLARCGERPARAPKKREPFGVLLNDNGN